MTPTSSDMNPMYTLHPAQEPALPLVCDSPHSGTVYPDDFRPVLPLSELRAAEDTHVEALWAAAPALGATLLEAHFPRSYLDLNRSLDDIDPLLLDGVWPTPLSPGEKTRLGSGLIWRSLRNQPVYDRLLPVQEVQQRIERCYRPYHAAFVPAAEPAFSGDQFRMSELTAAVALAQLRKVDRIRDHYRRLSGRIVPRLAGLKGLSLRRVPDPAGEFGFEIYFFLHDAGLVAQFRAKLDTLNVNCNQRTGTYPQYNRDYVKTGLAHTPAASPFREFKEWPAPGYRAADFPRTEDLTRRFVAIPIGWLYTEADADYIADSIIAVHKECLGG